MKKTMSATALAPEDIEPTEIAMHTDKPLGQIFSHIPADSGPAGLRRIVLTGFMGAGKSTVGALLAQQLGWRFLDIDDAVEIRAGMPVSRIFSSLGEFVFRRLETSAIAHALGERDVVIALGGGAPEVLANRLLLEQTPNTAVVFLEAPLGILLDRCASQANAAIRPNLQSPTAAEERFRYRAPLYRRCARHHLSTAGQTPAQTAEALRSLLRVQPTR